MPNVLPAKRRMMTEEEATITANRIRKNFDETAALYLDYVEREGWRAQKYSSLEAAIEHEFPFSQRTLQRWCEVSKLKREIGLPADDKIADDSLLALKALPAERRSEAFGKARELCGTDRPPKKLVQRVIDDMLQTAARATSAAARDNGQVVLDVRFEEAGTDELPADSAVPAEDHGMSFADRSPGDGLAAPERRDVPREPGEDDDWSEDGEVPTDAPAVLPSESLSSRRAALSPPEDDRKWLASLPAWSKLSVAKRDRFAADALAWRESRQAVKAFHREINPILAKAERAARKPEWVRAMRTFFRWRGPLEWQSCGDCGGTGSRVLLGVDGACGTCQGRGYHIR